MKTVLITGATGLIGQEIVDVCRDNEVMVHYLTTSKNKISFEANYKGFYWNPDTKEIDLSCFNGVDTIINLVGTSISKRWTPEYKKAIISSRTDTVKLLFDTIKANNFPVKHIVSASAIGIYPSSQTKYYDENFDTKSESFLGHVVQQWEAAVDQFSSLNIKVSKIRIGLVLSKKGGALPKIAKPIRFGAGTAFGDGEQWQSWIHIEDLAQLFMFIAKNRYEGIFNGVAPNPTTNTEFMKITARVLKKPLVLPNMPKFFLKTLLGEMHVLLTESQRVSSCKVEGLGFGFRYHHLEPAIENLLG